MLTAVPGRQADVSLARASVGVLVRRVWEALEGRECTSADRAWLKIMLPPNEYELWSRLGGYEQAHALRTALELERLLADTPRVERITWIAVALLCDIGKLASNVSLPERMLALVHWQIRVNRDGAALEGGATGIEAPGWAVPAARRTGRPHDSRGGRRRSDRTVVRASSGHGVARRIRDPATDRHRADSVRRKIGGAILPAALFPGR
jgi:hypothetical protein